MLTREFPPDVYGGAGVHVDFLVRELRRLVDVDVHCFGAPREGAVAHAPPAGLAGANAALQTLGVDLEIAEAVAGVRPAALAHLVRQHGRRARRRCCTASRTS